MLKCRRNRIKAPLLIASWAVSMGLLVAARSGAQEPPKPAQPPSASNRPPGGPGGFGGFGQSERPLVAQFDKDKSGWLDREERAAARAFITKERAIAQAQRGGGGGGPGRPGGGGPRPFGGGRPNREPPKPGPRVTPADVKNYPDSALFEPSVLRTVFLEFENPDWEAEMADFRGTDVEVPVTLTVDGKKYPNVGVHFRGASSYMMVPAGFKRSMGLSMDLADGKQRLYGHRSLNFLNSHGDPTFLRTVLYSYVARQYLPAPRANLVKVVVNGESWGVYANAENFDKDFIDHWFKSNEKGNTKAARWKVKGSPRGGGGLVYTGDDVEEYKRRYELKGKDDPKAWAALIKLCQTIDKTPADQLEAALNPMLDVEGVLRFLALDDALVNNDGYWVRDSDYSIYLDPEGRFHIVPHDMNETFQGSAGGRGGGGGGRASGAELDPLVALDDARKPLRSKLLKVPALRTRYLAIVRDIAEKWLDWDRLKPIVDQYVALAEKDVVADTRKLEPTEAFRRGIYKANDGAKRDDPTASAPNPAGGPGRPGGAGGMSLQEFVEKRSEFLLKHPEVKAASVATPVGP